MMSTISPAELSQAAVYHAAEQHQIDLKNLPSPLLVDAILDREREASRPENRSAIVACYGAWLGEFLNHAFDGRWVGIDQPNPPRIRLQGVDYSPMDAVERRLTLASAPTLQSLFDELRKRTEVESWSRSDILKANEAAWDRLIGDTRFVEFDSVAVDPEAARLSLDSSILSLGELSGKRLLALAAGGGKHGPLYAAAGLDVTVVDASELQLEIDRSLGEQHGLKLKTIKTSMDDLSLLDDASFDIVLQPVSMSYLADVDSVYREVARVLRSRGIYLVQHKHPLSLRADETWNAGYTIRSPASDGKPLNRQVGESAIREKAAIEFAHSLDRLIGGLCRAGFLIEEFGEPIRADAWSQPGSAAHRALYIPPYFKLKAIRK
jgi:2-polyprenyl-3-methyl-5-hydroxy-6-metoxy-1,4-benzoquinol methylase